MSKRRKSDLTPLGTILENVISDFRHKPAGQLSVIWDVWEKAVGEIVSENARPAAFKGRLLLVTVTSSTWMHQLRFLKNDIIRKVNLELGSDAVEDIRFKIGVL